MTASVTVTRNGVEITSGLSRTVADTLVVLLVGARTEVTIAAGEVLDKFAQGWFHDPIETPDGQWAMFGRVGPFSVARNRFVQ